MFCCLSQSTKAPKCQPQSRHLLTPAPHPRLPCRHPQRLRARPHARLRVSSPPEDARTVVHAWYRRTERSHNFSLRPCTWHVCPPRVGPACEPPARRERRQKRERPRRDPRQQASPLPRAHSAVWLQEIGEVRTVAPLPARRTARPQHLAAQPSDAEHQASDWNWIRCNAGADVVHEQKLRSYAAQMRGSMAGKEAHTSDAAHDAATQGLR